MMTERRIVVYEGATRRRVTARMLVCPECDRVEFFCFFPDGINHLHFQCANCGISFCDGCTAVAGDVGNQSPPATEVN